MTPNYGMGAIDWSSIDYSTIAKDPMFMQLQRQNKAYQDSLAQAYANAQVSQPIIQDSIPTTYTRQIDYATTKPESSDASNWVLGVGGAATVISGLVVGGAAIKHGGFGKGLKAIGDFLTGKTGELLKPTRAMKAFTFKAKDGSIITVADGKISKIMAAGEPKVYTTQSEIATQLSKEKLAFLQNPKNIVKDGKIVENVSVDKFVITKTFGGDKYQFIVDSEGKITQIFKNGKKQINVNSAVEKLDSKYDSVEKLITDLVKDRKVGKGISIRSYAYNNEGVDFTYKTTIEKGKEKVTQKLTVPGELIEQKGAARDAWLFDNKETEKTVNELIKNGRAETVARKCFVYKDKDGNELTVNKDGVIEKIKLSKKPKTGPQEFKKGSQEYKSWLYNNKDTEAAVKKEYESGLASEGAEFVTK